MSNEIDAPTMGQKNYNGAFGNASASHLFVSLSAAAIGSVVNLGHFSGGTRIDDLKVISEALGASTDIDIGVTYPSGETVDDLAKFMSIDTVVAKTSGYDGKPEQPPESFILTATVRNAIATGRVDVLVNYSFVG